MDKGKIYPNTSNPITIAHVYVSIYKFTSKDMSLPTHLYLFYNNHLICSESCRGSKNIPSELTKMATAASTMASQLNRSLATSFTRGLATPKGISGKTFRVLPGKSTFTIKAVQSEKPTYQVIQPINGDPFIGSLETPVTSSPLIAWYLSNLPGYRTAVNPLLRGIEVGLAHGFFLVGPFVKAGPLRNTEYAGAAGSLAAGGLVVILSICLTMYGIASFKEGEPSIAPSLTLTGRKKEPDQLQTADGWAKFSGGFFFGGISGVIWAYYLLYVLDLPYYVK